MIVTRRCQQCTEAPSEIQAECWACGGQGFVTMSCEYDLVIPETRVVVGWGGTDRDKADLAAKDYETMYGVKVMVEENWRG